MPNQLSTLADQQQLSTGSMPTLSPLPFPSVPRAALVAARFLRPPGKFKRAEQREHPRRKVGAFSNAVRTAVRLREKARVYSLIPPPRLIPIPLPVKRKQLESVRGVPSVSSEALQQRLQFLLSPAAVEQQKAAKMQRGLTPYQAELFMWDRQMRDLRKIYRAQYLQRLAEVTEEERHLQLQLFLQERRERAARREELLQRLYEDKKRRAVLKDRIRIEKKVTQALQTARVSRRKIGRLLWLQKLQNASDFIKKQEEAKVNLAAAAINTGQKRGSGGVEDERDILLRANAEEHALAQALAQAKEKAFEQIETRNISVPDLLRQLGQNTDEKEKSIKKKITNTDDVFREIMEASFAILPEDGPQYEEDGGYIGRKQAEQVLSDRQRAALTYAGFDEKEKLRLLDEKIAMLNRKLDEDYALRGGPQSLMYVQLRDLLQAAKIAHQEKAYTEKTAERLLQAQKKELFSDSEYPSNFAGKAERGEK